MSNEIWDPARTSSDRHRQTKGGRPVAADEHSGTASDQRAVRKYTSESTDVGSVDAVTSVGDRPELGTNPVDSDARGGTARLRPEVVRSRLALADAASVLIGAGVAFTVWIIVRQPGGQSIPMHLLLFAVSFPGWLAAIVGRKLLQARSVSNPAEELRRIWSASAIGAGLTVLIGFTLGYEALSRGLIMLLFMSVGAVMTVERWIARQHFVRLRRSGRLSRRVAVIGTDAGAIRLMHTLQARRAHGYEVVGYLGAEDIGPRGGCRWLGHIDDAEHVLRTNECIGAILSLPSVGPDTVNRLARRLTDVGLHVALSTGLADIDIARLRPQSVDHRTMLYIEPTIRDGWRRHAKRAFDIATATVALVTAAPLLIVAALLIKLDSRGPVLFRQPRVGLGGSAFEIIKLRTMSTDAEERLDEVAEHNISDGGLFKASRDPRVTRVGRMLRMWSVDEIPQFVNVLRNEMSIVGPRPALPREVAHWDDDTLERLRVMPGITGLWQVEGRASTSFDVYKRLDLFYVDNWALSHDIVIVLKTFKAVVTRRGAI